jgi:hypothetical protein
VSPDTASKRAHRFAEMPRTTSVKMNTATCPIVRMFENRRVIVVGVQAFRESVKGLRGTEYKVARRKRQESEADLYASQIRKASSTMTRDMRACFLALRGLTSDNSNRGKGVTHWEGG